MASNTNPKGYYQFVLAFDCETSGMFFGQDDPSCDPILGKYAQIVSAGLIVADAKTFTPIEELYVEIKWDKKSVWDSRAEKVHGLSKDYLEKNGKEPWEAVEAIGNLVLDYFGPSNAIKLLGHNVALFDLWFLRRLMRSEGIELNFGSRVIDTSTIGHVVYGVYNSDDLFELMGVEKREHHNALDDARASLLAVQQTRALFEQCVGG